MELKNPQYIAALTEKEADMNLFSPIGQGGTNGQDFADEIQLLNDFGVTNINVHINTVGGEVIEGQAIFSAIINSKATVTTIAEGTVASMGAIILLAGDRIKMLESARLMFHGPGLEGGAEPNDNQKTAIDALRGSLETIVGSRTGKNKTEVAALLESGKDTWLTPAEALTGKFIDEIVTIKHLKELKQQPKSKIAAELSEIINKQEEPKLEPMKNLCKYLNINESSTEEAILDAIKSIATNLATSEESLTTANLEVKTKGEKITALELTLKGFEDSKIDAEATTLEETVDAGIKAEKLDADKKDEYLNSFKGNVEGLKLVLGTLEKAAPGAAPKVTDKLTEADNAVITAEVKAKGWRELEKNDAKAAKNIMDNHPALYKEMYKAEYKVDAPVVA